MIKIKRGVRLHGVIPQTMLIISVANDTWVNLGFGHLFCVTAGIEGKHKRKSEHAGGRAIDLRTWSDRTGIQMSDHTKANIVQQLQDALGEEYFVQAEGNHIHAHYRPILVEF